MTQMSSIDELLKLSPQWHDHPVWRPILRGIFVIDWQVPSCCRRKNVADSVLRRLTGYNVLVKHVVLKMRQEKTGGMNYMRVAAHGWNSLSREDKDIVIQIANILNRGDDLMPPHLHERLTRIISRLDLAEC